ncbi:MAG TPA: AbrB/MazE/SpoVT family DNA-binding domain-containing protein [Candidatus Hydromicrobium sp.]
MKIVKISNKFQIAIPKKIRNIIGLSAGDTLIIDVDENRIILTPLTKKYTDYSHKLHSKVWINIDIDGYIKKERESWDC